MEDNKGLFDTLKFEIFFDIERYKLDATICETLKATSAFDKYLKNYQDFLKFTELLLASPYVSIMQIANYLKWHEHFTSSRQIIINLYALLAGIIKDGCSIETITGVLKGFNEFERNKNSSTNFRIERLYTNLENLDSIRPYKLNDKVMTVLVTIKKRIIDRYIFLSDALSDYCELHLIKTDNGTKSIPKFSALRGKETLIVWLKAVLIKIIDINHPKIFDQILISTDNEFELFKTLDKIIQIFLAQPKSKEFKFTEFCKNLIEKKLKCPLPIFDYQKKADLIPTQSLLIELCKQINEFPQTYTPTTNICARALNHIATTNKRENTLADKPFFLTTTLKKMLIVLWQPLVNRNNVFLMFDAVASLVGSMPIALHFIESMGKIFNLLEQYKKNIGAVNAEGSFSSTKNFYYLANIMTYCAKIYEACLSSDSQKFSDALQLLTNSLSENSIPSRDILTCMKELWDEKNVNLNKATILEQLSMTHVSLYEIVVELLLETQSEVDPKTVINDFKSAIKDFLLKNKINDDSALHNIRNDTVAAFEILLPKEFIDYNFQKENVISSLSNCIKNYLAQGNNKEAFQAFFTTVYKSTPLFTNTTNLAPKGWLLDNTHRSHSVPANRPTISRAPNA